MNLVSRYSKNIRNDAERKNIKYLAEYWMTKERFAAITKLLTYRFQVRIEVLCAISLSFTFWQL